jgi:predicted membrane protein
MENQSEYNKPENDLMQRWESEHRRGRLFGGLIIVGVGVLFLAREMGALIPHWLFTWKFLLIVIGVFIGVKHSFRGFGWMVPIFIGGAFLMQDIYPELPLANYIWPVAIIAFGLMMIFRPRRNFRNYYWRKNYGREKWKEYRHERQEGTTSENYLEINSVFSGVKKTILSKDFKGGEVNVVFGSAEINLSHADITGTVVIEINNVFGGTRLIVPPHWEVRSELNAVMGGVEDKRVIYKDAVHDAGKILILKGDVVFGGVDIQSY